MAQKWKENVIGLIGIVIGFISLIPNSEDRLLTAVILGAVIVFYILNSFSDEIEIYEERLQKLEEKLKIHEQLIEIKSDIKHLKEKSLKRS
ncbi:hypothetical protein HZA99_02975 [Candidatus Woesearchaeota archaeon]|nr:hypothetical protein [Candidatus Woesearchaeota archaeon]